jgi:protein gp37
VKHWREPLDWNRDAMEAAERRRVFSSSMCDIGEDHPDIIREVAKLWPLIRATPWLDWQLLTKRPERYPIILPSDWGDGYPNVWLGTSIENNGYIERADFLRAVPATVRFISYEPALGPLDELDLTGIDWLIYGGESGPGWRPEDKQWARDIRARCESGSTAFFHKQSAAFRTELGIELDGQIVRNYPVRRLPLPVL